MSATTDDTITGWFLGRLDEDWFASPPTIEIDREEILVLGEITPPALPEDANDVVRTEAIASRVDDFRKTTRRRRVAIAKAAEATFGRKVSWGVVCAGSEVMFTTLAAPTMTRLRMPERRVLDTLIDAGVARSRSEALAWCVRLVGEHTAEWLDELRSALGAVEEVRQRRPT